MNFERGAGSIAYAVSAATMLLVVCSLVTGTAQSHLTSLFPHHNPQKEGKEEIKPCNTPHTLIKYRCASKNKLAVLHSYP